MSTYIHESNLREQDKTLIKVRDLKNGWAEYVHPDRTCCKPMRGGKVCLLDKGHKSKRHTSSVYYCDACGKSRPNPPYKTQQVIIHGEVDDVFHYCFICTEVEPF